MIVLRTKQYSSFWQKLKGNPDLKNVLRTWDPNYVNPEVKKEPLFKHFPKQVLSWLSFLYENVRDENDSYMYGFLDRVNVFSYESVLEQLRGGRAGFSNQRREGVVKLLEIPMGEVGIYYLNYHVDEDRMSLLPESSRFDLSGRLADKISNGLFGELDYLPSRRERDPERLVDTIKKMFINKVPIDNVSIKNKRIFFTLAKKSKEIQT